MKKKPKKKYKVKYQNLIIALLIMYVLYFIAIGFLDKKISNIYIINNKYLTDLEIMEIAKISDYPSTITNTSRLIKKRLEDDIHIISAKVYKKNLTEVYIEVNENKPIFYNSSISKTVLSSGIGVNKTYDVPTLINYVPDTIYDLFREKMSEVNDEIIKRISEIEYNPNDVDDERFLLTMTDSNYVYLTLYKFESINSYVDIIKKFENKKGILYLDSGEYFKVMPS